MNQKLLQTILIGLALLMFGSASTEETQATSKVTEAPVTEAMVPFGANLFSGDFQTKRIDDLDPNYRLTAGDKVALHMWGQVTIDEILTVDGNGNIFIPEVGEVKVAGARSSELQGIVKKKVATVFREGEGVYVNLLTATPISVFVTGSVLRPGQYTGTASNSVLYYLFKAGGIDPNRGSYRNVRVLRQNRVIVQYDLYPFLRQGKIKPLKFKDGDTIVVAERASTIEISGDSLNPYRFEFLGPQLTGRQLIQYAKPAANVTHVAINGTRNRKAYSTYLPYNQFLNTRILNGDRVSFTSDTVQAVMGIRVEGSYLGTSYYSIKKGSRLREILDYIEVDEQTADIKNIYIKRKSIARQQRKNLLDSISRLQRTLFTASSGSEGEAQLRVKESELILKYIEEARNTEIAGQVVVSENGRIANIRLEEDDIIVIPQKSDVVTISGEVMIPQSMVYARNATIHDYINRSGGFAQRADEIRLVVRRPNGKVDMGSNLRVNPGDQVIVFPRIDPKQRQNLKDWVQIIYQIAIATVAITK